MLHALLFLSVSSPVPIGAATQSADGYVASLPHFSSSLSSVDLFFHTRPSPLMLLKSDLSRSHCWCVGLPVLGIPEGLWARAFLKAESSCHAVAASIPNRWTRHRMKTAAGERRYPPKDCEREIQPAEKKGEARLNP